jgi:hypothetical protein
MEVEIVCDRCGHRAPAPHLRGRTCFAYLPSGLCRGTFVEKEDAAPAVESRAQENDAAPRQDRGRA